MRPIRSAIVSFHFPPHFAGGGLQVSRLMQGLAAEGVEPVALVARPPDLDAPMTEPAFGGRVVRFRTPAARPAVREIVFGLKVAWWLLRHPSEWDLLHISGYGYFCLPLVRVARRRHRPVLVKTTLLGSKRIFGRDKRWARRRMFDFYKSVDAIVTLSDELSAQFEEEPGVKAVVQRIPNGVDVERFRPGDPSERLRTRAEHGIAEDALVLVSTGQVGDRKNAVYLVEAVARMTTPGPICIALAGPPGDDPAYDRRLAEATAALPSRAEVRRLGRLDAEGVAALLRASDVFVLPSKQEGLPNALLEAMATGLACVSSDIPGSAGVLRDGGGLLVPLDDVDGLARELDGLDAARRKMLGDEALAVIQGTYTLPKIAARYLALYRRILGEHFPELGR